MRPWRVQDHSSSADLRHLRVRQICHACCFTEMVYLKDCPQRSDVSMHSSVRLVGNLRHSAARRAMSIVERRSRGLFRGECP
jgi:hypothetical protein